MRKYKKYNCFWREDSSEMVSFLHTLEPYIRAGVVTFDEDDNDGTALVVDIEISDFFEQLAKEHNIEI